MKNYWIASILIITGIVAIYLLVISPRITEMEQAKYSPAQIKADISNSSLPNKASFVRWPIVNSRLPVEPINLDSLGSLNQPPELGLLAKFEQDEIAPSGLLTQLLRLLKSNNPAVRLSVVELVSEIKHPDAQMVLIESLNDNHANIRIAAIEGLVQHLGPSQVRLLEAMIYDQDKDVRVAAVEAIGEFESEESIYALSGLLVDVDQDVRVKAVNALGDIGGQIADSYLRQLIYDPNEMIRENALAILDESDG